MQRISIALSALISQTISSSGCVQSHQNPQLLHKPWLPFLLTPINRSQGLLNVDFKMFLLTMNTGYSSPTLGHNLQDIFKICPKIIVKLITSLS